MEIQKKNPAVCAGEGYRVNEIRRRGKEESVTSRECEVKGRVCEVSLGQRGGSSYGEGGGE